MSKPSHASQGIFMADPLPAATILFSGLVDRFAGNWATENWAARKFGNGKFGNHFLVGSVKSATVKWATINWATDS